MPGALHLCYFMIQVQIIVAELQNGWIPLSREEVLNRINSGASRSVMIENGFMDIGLSPDIERLKKEAIKLVDPQYKTIGVENAVNSLLINSKPIDSITASQDKSINQDFDEEKERGEIYSTTSSSISSIETNKRRAKAVKNTGSPENILNDLVHKESLPIEQQDLLYIGDLSKGKADYSKHRKSYEVMENLSDVAETDVSQLGYAYKLPTNAIKNEKAVNTTSKLLSILSKYNIKPEDTSPNYIISRQNKVGNSNIMLLPVSFKIPTRFNSLNHIATDPLLAVLLSNYGYYLPGLYGIHNKYRNLYGYLASNNLHNNKPFGSYKIFSDTDSSY